MTTKTAPTTRRRSLLLAALALPAALILTGCMDLEQTAVVNDDGSGTFTYILAIDKDSPTLNTAEGSDVQSTCESEDDAASKLPANVTVTPIDTPSACGSKITITFDSPEEFASTIEQARADAKDEADGPGPDLFAGLSLARTATGWRFENGLLSGLIPYDETALEPGSSPLDNPQYAGLLVSAVSSYKLSVTLPGIAGATNATSTEGTTFRWEIKGRDVADKRFATLFAETTLATAEPVATTSTEQQGKGDGGSTLPVVPIGIGVLALGAAGFVLARRR